MPREATGRMIKVESDALALARAKWASSGLTDLHAKRLRLRPLAPEETAELGKFHPIRALHIPYFDLDGSPTKFYRIRYLEKLPGFAGVVEKPQRYAQPAGTLNEVYLPPILKRSWADIATDPAVPIIFTEGELKAASACAIDLPAIGLGGVDVWLSSKREIPFLPTLEQIKWDNRRVVIVYDSDAATNPNVVRAQRKLARELVSRGAIPTVAALPPAEKCRKGGKGTYCKVDLSCGCQGLDDLLVSSGADKLHEVVKNAPGFPEAEALWGLNEEVLYVREPGIVVVKDTGQKLDPGSFVAHAYANRHYMHAESTKDGGTVLKKKKLAPHWIEWEHRHEVDGITYAPGKPKIHDGKWNAWPGWGCEPVKGDTSPWHWLLDFVFKGHPTTREWFERWCAYPIQHPGTKLYTGSVIWGFNQGTGKSFIAYALMGIYGKNAVAIGNKDLRGGFNAWQANRQFIYGDEIAGTDVNSKKIDADWLKTLITQPTAKINEKYMPEIVLPDCANYLFNSNRQDNCFLDDDDRRYMVHEVVGKAAERAFYDSADKWLGLRNGVYHGPGRAHLFDHLLNVPLKDFNPRGHAPMTMAKQQMILTSKNDHGLWCVTLREDPARALAPLGEEAAKNCDLFTAGQLLHAYDPEKHGKVTAGGLSRELGKNGFRQVYDGVTVRTVLGIVRLYAVRNKEQWATATQKQIVEHFNKFFGPGSKKHN
jgi:hypothetical protein